MVRGEVLYDDEGKARIFGNGAQELAEGLQSACGSADGGDREGFRCREMGKRDLGRQEPRDFCGLGLGFALGHSRLLRLSILQLPP